MMMTPWRKQIMRREDMLWVDIVKTSVLRVLRLGHQWPASAAGHNDSGIVRSNIQQAPPPVPIHPSNIYDSLTHNITMYEISGLDPSCLILNIIRKWCLDSWPHFKVCISYLDIHCCPCPSRHRGCCQRLRVLAAREGGGCQHWPAARLLSPAIGNPSKWIKWSQQ